MKILFSLVVAAATNPDAAGAAAVAATGGPALVVQDSGQTPGLIAHWASNVGTGWHQFYPQSGHDETRGNRIGVVAGQQRMLLRKGRIQDLNPQETLRYAIAGSAAAVEYGMMLLAYPGHRAGSETFIDYGYLDKNAESPTTVYANLDTLAEGFSGEELLTAESQLLIANRRYAIVGMSTTVERAALTLRGPDFGQGFIGCPGDAENYERQSEWFVNLSRETGLPCIPTFYSAQLPNTFVGCVGRAADADAKVTVHLELLKKGA